MNPTSATALVEAEQPVELTPERDPAAVRRRPPEFVRLLLTNGKSAFGLGVLAVISLGALLAPVIAAHPPNDFVALPGQAPSRAHPFGTTDQGFDVFAQVLFGGRMSLAVAGSAAILSTIVAATIGMVAAYRGGLVDEALTLLTNIFLVIPSLPLLIVISAYLPVEGGWVMAVIIAVTAWPGEARILRSQALSLRSRDFVLAAQVAGESTARIVFGEIMPNMVSRIVAGFLGAFVFAIALQAGLEFLGFGDVDSVSWGTILFWAQNNSTLLSGEWWHFLFPGMAIALAATGLIFVNYGVDEISNPRLRGVKRRRWIRGDR